MKNTFEQMPHFNLSPVCFFSCSFQTLEALKDW